ncbi:MAG TPA: hypothetical protein VFW87_08290 [Pirellulales bacterium]|nr:hypothetical protein [Pirellulales bacterium]
MNRWPLLLADAETIKIILVVVAGLIALVKHFFDANAKAQPRRPVAKPDARPRPKPPAAPAGRPALPGDVNEFLRRAAEKRAAAQRSLGHERGPLSDERGPLANEPEQPRRLVTSQAEALPSEVIDAHAVDEAHLARRMGDRVEQHLGRGEFDERLGHLTHVDRSEAAFQAHFQQTFQHHVGQLETQASETAAPLAADAPWVALLADPANMRQAIVLNEILQRPVDRWQ